LKRRKKSDRDPKGGLKKGARKFKKNAERGRGRRHADRGVLEFAILGRGRRAKNLESKGRGTQKEKNYAPQKKGRKA